MVCLTRELFEQVNRVAGWLPCGTKLDSVTLYSSPIYPKRGWVGTDSTPDICRATGGQTAESQLSHAAR